MIYFEIEGEGYAIAAAELAGVATACPFTTYPGLPDGVGGIIQWSGKIFPVLPATGVDFRACTYLISTEGLDGPFAEIALAVPGPVRVFITEEPAPAHGSIVKDKEGCEAKVMSLGEVSKEVTLAA